MVEEFVDEFSGLLIAEKFSGDQIVTWYFNPLRQMIACFKGPVKGSFLFKVLL